VELGGRRRRSRGHSPRRTLDARPGLDPRPLFTRWPWAHHLHGIWALRRCRRRAGLGPLERPAHL